MTILSYRLKVVYLKWIILDFYLIMCHYNTVIVYVAGNFVFGLAEPSIYGSCKARKQQFVMRLLYYINSIQNIV